MANELAQAYRLQRDAEMDVAERARAALHIIGWDALQDAARHDTTTVLAGPTPGHDRFLPDFAFDVEQEGQATPMYVAVATDGSQVDPDSRHRYPLAAVQAASVTMYRDRPHRYDLRQWGPDDPAIVEILLSGDTRKRMLSRIEGLRDLKELEMLLTACASASPDHEILVAMVDGPLHIYRPSDVAARAPIYAAIRNLPAYLVGVVDRGEAKYLTAALARATGDEELGRVRDADLFGHLLPGQRSALFGLSSPSDTRLATLNGWKTGFFYLNPGDGLLRVETITAMGLRDVTLLARIMLDASVGPNYPYILKAVHDLAEIKAGTRRDMTHRHEAALHAYSLSDGLMSHKETLKEL